MLKLPHLELNLIKYILLQLLQFREFPCLLLLLIDLVDIVVLLASRGFPLGEMLLDFLGFNKKLFRRQLVLRARSYLVLVFFLSDLLDNEAWNILQLLLFLLPLFRLSLSLLILPKRGLYILFDFSSELIPLPLGFRVFLDRFDALFRGEAALCSFLHKLEFKK